MADLLRTSPIERDVEQAITALKKGAYLLKYGRRGKPKFCPFRLSNDESMLMWYSGKDEKQLKLSHVSRIIPGQRTAIFQRHPRPEKEYQSFSLIYGDRSLDLICKDKDEAEVWFVGLKALVSRGNHRKWRTESKSDRTSSDASSSSTFTQRNSPLNSPFDSSDIFHKDPSDQLNPAPSESPPHNDFGKAFSDVILFKTVPKGSNQSDSVSNSLSSFSSGGADTLNGRVSTVDGFRVSLSSAVSSSSQGSGHEDCDALGDVFIWGEGTGDGVLGGGAHRVGSSSSAKTDALLPKALESTVVLDVQNIACGSKHAVLVTKQGEVFSWGEEAGGRLGHGVEADVSLPKLVDALGGMNIELVACGEYHTCAVTLSGDLYTWGDGICNSGLLGHGSVISHWIPKKVIGLMEGIHVSYVSCGPWHSAVVTSAGQLFTFGEGTFGALGHGDRTSSSIPREVEALKGLRSMRTACGVWHTAAVVETLIGSSNSSSHPSGKLFTWGDGDKGRLGHGDYESRLVPARVAALVEPSFSQVACGHDITIALTNSGQVYAMGSTVFGQLGSLEADGKVPVRIKGKLQDNFVEEIACGSYHVAVLTSRTEVYTWGKGANGRLGHGDVDDRNTPTLVEALKNKQVKSVICGSSFTAVICLHKWVSSTDHSLCSRCRLPFGFRRKRHNCYNCGLVFCKACSSRKSIKASLAPNVNKPYRVCDDCFTKLKKVREAGSMAQHVKNQDQNSNVGVKKEAANPKLHGQLSRLSSVESLKHDEGRQSKHSRKIEPNNTHFFPSLNGSYQWGSFYSSKSSNFMFGSSKKIVSASVPGSRMVSRATSPVSRRSSPPRSATPPPTLKVSPEVSENDSKQLNDNLTKEIIKLRMQVDDLTRKSQHLEVELEKTSRQLKEASEVADEETAKCKAAKEVIKSLTAQLKDMAMMIPEGSLGGNKSGSMASDTSNILSLVSTDNHLGMTDSHLPESNGHMSSSPFCNGTKTPTDDAEWVEQDEPGVYITLSSLPGGCKELKRVRFSRRRFSEKQAEKWWTENGVRVHEKYNIVTTEKTAAAPLSPSNDKDDSND